VGSTGIGASVGLALHRGDGEIASLAVKRSPLASGVGFSHGLPSLPPHVQDRAGSASEPEQERRQHVSRPAWRMVHAPRGTRATVGVPGTGLSYTEQSRHHHVGVGLLVLLILAVIVIAAIGSA
jgi:hypothetical protein